MGSVAAGGDLSMAGGWHADRHGAGVGPSSTTDQPRLKPKSSAVRHGYPAIRAAALYVEAEK